MRHILKPLCMTVLASSLLTGCLATSTLWDKTVSTTPEDVTILNDDIVAFGKPKTPLAQYPYAMAMVGTTNDYLVTSGESDKAILQKIFSELDGKALHLLSSSESKTPAKAIYTSFFEGNVRVNFQVNPDIHHQEQAKTSLQTSGASTKATIAFFKPAKDVSSKEKDKLNSLGFSCITDKLQYEGRGSTKDKYTDDSTLYTFCQRPTQMDLTVIQKTTDNSQLSHKFKRPLKIQATYRTKNRPVGDKVVNTGIILITPVALAVDIVTAPLQLVFCSLAWCK